MSPSALVWLADVFLTVAGQMYSSVAQRNKVSLVSLAVLVSRASWLAFILAVLTSALVDQEHGEAIVELSVKSHKWSKHVYHKQI